MSLTYEVLKRAVKLINLRKKFSMSEKELIETAKKENSAERIELLRDPDFEISLISVSGFPLMKMIHKEKTEKACLFIIGGGMIRAPRPDSIRKALKIAKQSGSDLYIPYYPLCTEHSLSEAYDMIHASYLRMLEAYEAEKITVLGTSSGGNLALGLIAYINANHLNTPKPHQIVSISPGTCAADDEEYRRMEEIDHLDVMIPAKFMKTAEQIMKHSGENIPDYMIYLQKGDFSDCCKVTFMYGSDETLYGAAPSFEEAMKKYNVDYRMIVGKGMFHCYPVFPFCPEAKEGWNQMIDIMKNG